MTAGTPTVEFTFAYGGGKEATSGIYYISQGDRITTHHKRKFKWPMAGALTRICLVSAEVEKYVKRDFTCITCTVSKAGDDNENDIIATASFPSC